VLQAEHPQFEAPTADEQLLHPDPEALRAVPAALAHRCRALPLRMTREEITVAMANPADVVAVDDLRAATNRRVRVVAAAAPVLQQHLARHYGPQPTSLRADAGPRTGTEQSAATSAASKAEPKLRATPGPLLFGKVRVQDRAVFFSELYTMLNAGVGLFRALDTIGETIRPVRLAEVVRRLREGVQGGKPLSDAMRRYPDVFSTLNCAIFAAGESGGFLAEAAHRCAEYSEREFRLQQKIKRETWYPKLVLLAFVFIPTVPTLVLQGLRPWLSQLAGIGLAAVPFVLAAVLLWQALKAAGKSDSTRQTLDSIKLSLPLFGKVSKRLAFARFSRAMSALYTAGLGFVRGVPLAAEATGNEAIADHLRRSVPRIQEGTPLSEVLEASRHVPPMVVQMVRTGEQTGQIDSMLDKVADYFEQEADTAIHQMVVTLTPICVLLLGVLVAVKVIAFYTGFYAF
jgi:type II secretory pathway component PulF